MECPLNSKVYLFRRKIIIMKTDIPRHNDFVEKGKVTIHLYEVI